MRAGDKLGPYRLCLKVGEGGMASVYLARTSLRTGLHRFVAIKCIREELARDQKFVEMFLDEAAIASQINHVNVCSVLDSNSDRGVQYLVMEYLSGQTMASILRRLAAEPDLLPPARRAGLVARLMADACEGLHAVHELRNSRGQRLDVVHRDICPANLFVTYDGTVKIVDFGVARAAERRHRTRSGVVKGKYSYLAPELLEGATPDRRADIWALGVVAWELLTGRRLFRAETDIETLRAIDGSQEILPPSRVSDGIPELIDDIVMCALSRDREQRYDDAREMGRLFTQFLVEEKMAVGLAEVADAMDLLFPQGRACTRQLFDVAEQIDSAPEIPLVPIDAVGTVLETDEVEIITCDESGSYGDQAGPWSAAAARLKPVANAAAAAATVVAVAIASFHCGSRDGTPPAAAEISAPVQAISPARDRETAPYQVEVVPTAAEGLPTSTEGRDIVFRLRLDPSSLEAPPPALAP